MLRALTDDQLKYLKTIITKYADCFALSLSEVNAIPGAVHKLNVPPNTTFRTKAPQRAYNPDQRKFMAVKVDELLEADIIEPIHPTDVRCVAPTVLAQKAHEGGGLQLDELKHRINDQCVMHGLPSAFDLPPRPLPNNASNPIQLKKWRICQDFTEINKVTEIAAVPQGDIRAKQLRLSGHRYVHTFDFAAGFYGITVHPNSRPYLTFFVEGRGHFAYKRMPFGTSAYP